MVTISIKKIEATTIPHLRNKGFARFSSSSFSSKHANKKIKSLLNMCAKSAIQHDVQLKEYYHRKTQEGKEKMSVINAVRNKIIARVFAVVERKTPFVDTYKFAA